MSIGECIELLRFTCPELFAGWVGLFIADVLTWIAFVIVKASESASASKINDSSVVIEWEWEL